ncbi:MAG: SRPBCC family protein, partial [Dehalococcoidia bacterium]|nr:SRPBCC family protein [Dehalococcoidia bacterium]
MKVEKSIEIAAPPEKIWSLVSERENLLRWHPRAQRFDFIGEQRSGVGATFYMEGKSDGGPTRSVCEITEWQENKKFAFHEILGMTKKFDAAFTIEATETGSRLTMLWDTVLPYWIIGKIMLLFFRKQWAKMTDQMLTNIERLA